MSTPMQNAIRDALSPEAVALATSELAWAAKPDRLLLARCDDEDVDMEVRWFAKQLVELLGGQEVWSQVCKGIGL